MCFSLCGCISRTVDTQTTEQHINSIYLFTGKEVTEMGRVIGATDYLRYIIYHANKLGKRLVYAELCAIAYLAEVDYWHRTKKRIIREEYFTGYPGPFLFRAEPYMGNCYTPINPSGIYACGFSKDFALLDKWLDQYIGMSKEELLHKCEVDKLYAHAYKYKEFNQVDFV